VKSLPAYRTIETSINRDTLISIIDVWLQSVSIINDNETLVDIKFGDTDRDIIPISISFKTDQQVEFIKHGNKNE